MKILLIDHNKPFCEALSQWVQMRGIQMDYAHDSTTGEMLGSHAVYDAIVIAYSIPGINGEDILNHLVDYGVVVPLIMMVDDHKPALRIRLLNEGADDVIVRPFALEELIARIKASLRRYQGGLRRSFEFGSIQFYPGDGKLYSGRREIQLTPKEVGLLELLSINQHHALSKEKIIDRMWENYGEINENTIEVHISNLRKKLKSLDEHITIRNLRHIGYMLDFK